MVITIIVVVVNIINYYCYSHVHLLSFDGQQEKNSLRVCYS